MRSARCEGKKRVAAGIRAAPRDAERLCGVRIKFFAIFARYLRCEWKALWAREVLSC